MSSKEKVLAVRPGAVCYHSLLTGFVIIGVRPDNGTSQFLSAFADTEEEAWAAAYKYLTK